MSDLLQSLSKNPITAPLVKALGLPNPVELAREAGGYSALQLGGKKTLLIGTKGYAETALQAALREAGAEIVTQMPEGESRVDIVVMDATGCTRPEHFRALYDGFHPIMRRIAKNGRVLIAAADPAEIDEPVAAATARGIEGFMRSLGKELGAIGITVNLAYVAKAAADRVAGIVRFFCGPQTTYVSGQVVYVSAAVLPPKHLALDKVLVGKVALVTGSARGIGYATAQRLVQEGATVICVDVPQMTAELEKACAAIGATALPMDIASPDAPTAIADFIQKKFGGVDIVIHNAGITRDRTLANMKPHYWDLVVSVNFAAIVAIDEQLIQSKLLRDYGRIVCLSSISGVAGNFGQTNYGTTKAALIGYVAARAPQLAQRGICINAIAPGFIETPMTDAMPFATREIGKRLNSLKQGGKPRDVAELITFLSTPGVYGLTGNTIRVCGQQMLGA